MNRIEPPALPLWMLEHLTPAERDEALAGDLLEGFRGGRSNGWFWRQALGAWVGAWARYFARRRSVLLFLAVSQSGHSDCFHLLSVPDPHDCLPARLHIACGLSDWNPGVQVIHGTLRVR